VSGICIGKPMRRTRLPMSGSPASLSEQAFTGALLLPADLRPSEFVAAALDRWNTPLHGALSAARGGSLQEDWMKTLALALAAALAVGLSSPSLVNRAAAAQGLKVAQADVRVKVGGPHRSVKNVVVRRDRGLHRGWRHSRHYGATKKVVIKRSGDRVVKKTVITR
jgi:hypothetical protein